MKIGHPLQHPVISDVDGWRWQVRQRQVSVILESWSVKKGIERFRIVAEMA